MGFSFDRSLFSGRNAVSSIGFALAVYFSWPLAQGGRSYPRLLTLEREITAEEKSFDSIRQDRENLERRVIRLRPESIDSDLLEERARVLLGYQYPEDKVLLSKKTH